MAAKERMVSKVCVVRLVRLVWKALVVAVV